MDPWVKSQTSAKVAQLYMDNDPQNRINRSVRAQTLPPGRGLLVGADGDVGDFGGVSVGARRAVGPDRKIARMATFCLTMSLYGFSDTRAYPPGVADFTSAPHVPLTCWNTWGGVDQFDVGIGADD